MTLVERMARAMFGHDSGISDWTWDDTSFQSHYRGLALAALRAMREPTEAMEKAALDLEPYFASPDVVFVTMIDAAIAEHEKG